jgi:hypothetical protein
MTTASSRKALDGTSGGECSFGDEHTFGDGGIPGVRSISGTKRHVAGQDGK